MFILLTNGINNVSLCISFLMTKNSNSKTLQADLSGCGIIGTDENGV